MKSNGNSSIFLTGLYSQGYNIYLFTGVHLFIFNIVAPVIYLLLPNVWKASYTTGASTFVDVPYLLPYSTDKFITCVVLGLSQRFFHFGEEIVIPWTHIEWLWCMFQNLPLPAAQEVLTAAAVWLLALSWRKMGFCTTKCRPHASRKPWKHSCVLRHRATSILIQERCSSFVNMILGRSHYPYESQRSTHCSRMTEYCRRWLH